MKLSILKVTGSSMHPSLESGAFVLVWQSKRFNKPIHLLNKLPFIGHFISHYLALATALKVGDIVVVNHPKYGQIIKRVTKLDYAMDKCAMNKCAMHKCSAVKQQQLIDLKPITSKLLNLQSAKSRLVRLRLCGDNPAASVSEDDMGWVDIKYVIGKVVYVIGM